MNMHLRSVQCRAGFSLVEIMVGMVIGMIGVIVMMQVFRVSENYKRSTTGGGDAQTNGAMALYTLQKDVRQAGYGTSSPSLVGCSLQLRPGVTLNSMAPATINHANIPAGDANTDTLLIVYGDSNGQPEGDAIVMQPDQTTFSVVAPSSFAIGDMVIARTDVRPAPCNLQIEPAVSVTSPNPPNVSVAVGTAGVTGGRLFNLGPVPRILAYAIRGGRLTQCDFMVNDCSSTADAANTAVWVPIANNIVSLRAQYGRDLTGNGDMDFSQLAPPTCNDWLDVFALRIVLVSRSEQYIKDPITASAPALTGISQPTIDLSGNTEWQHYRYKVFESTVPLRNVVSLGGYTLGGAKCT